MIQIWKTRIVTDQAILVGKPVVAGTRISVELILGRLAFGWSVDEVVEAYPHITREDVLAALAFAADVLRQRPFVTVGSVERLVAEEEDGLD